MLIGRCVGNSYKSEVSYLNLSRIVDSTSDFCPVFSLSYQERARILPVNRLRPSSSRTILSLHS